MTISDGNGKRLKVWTVWLSERASQESELEDERERKREMEKCERERERERVESIIDGERSNKVMIFNFTL